MSIREHINSLKKKEEQQMFIITITRKQYCVNDIRTAADIVYCELGNESDLERLPYI